MEEQTKVEETKEVKPTYKKHGPLYWLIVIVGMAFIVFMSVRMGEKIAENREEESGSSKTTTTTSNSNSNATSNKVATMTSEEALELGNKYYNLASTDYNLLISGGSCSDSDSNGLSDCTTLYNKLKEDFATTNEIGIVTSNETKNIFSYFTEKDGKYYLTAGGIGFNGSTTYTLAVNTVEESKVTYTVTVVTKYNDPASPDQTKTYDFILVKENDAWKISKFMYTF